MEFQLDRTTLWTFRDRLFAPGASEAIFAAVQTKFAIQSYFACGGQIIGASLMPAPIQRKDNEEKTV